MYGFKCLWCRGNRTPTACILASASVSKYTCGLHPNLVHLCGQLSDHLLGNLLLQGGEQLRGSHLHRGLEQELNDSHNALGKAALGLGRVTDLEGGLQTLLDVAKVDGRLADLELQEHRVRQVGEACSCVLLQGQVAEQAVEHRADDEVTALLVVGVEVVAELEAVGQCDFVVVAGRSVCLNGGCSKQHDVGVCVPKHGLEQRGGVEPPPPTEVERLFRC